MRSRTAQSAKRAEMRCRALELRQRGHTYHAIAVELGVAWMTAWRYVQRSLADLAALEIKEAEKLRTMELSRLDYMLTRLESEIEAGQPKAIETALKIQERRCRLLGLDAPVKQEVLSENVHVFLPDAS